MMMKLAGPWSGPRSLTSGCDAEPRQILAGNYCRHAAADPTAIARRVPHGGGQVASRTWRA